MYISLHNHSHYSTLDGYQTVPEMVTRAKELGYTALSLTDHGTMRGIVDFYEECNRQEIKPILGCEFYFCENPEIKDRALTHHLVLLAMNNTGYHNLKLLDSEAYKEENYFFTMRLGLDELRRHSEGIICLTACMAGVLNTNRADWWMQELYGIFGDRLYAEIQPLNIPEQQEYNRKVIDLARKYNVPLVVTTDAHYATPADQPYHTLWNEIRGFSYHDNENYLWSEQEIRETAWIPEEVKDEAIKNTEYIASLCNATITMGGNHYPSYPTDNPSEEIRNICRKAWKDKVPKGRYKEYGERFNAEMVDLEKAGYLNYLLVIWDMLRWCMENNIPTGEGRGCSISGTKVLMYNGTSKNIEDIFIGDKVISHTGSIRPVTDTMRYEISEPMTRITVENRNPMTFTNDHKILVCRGGLCPKKASTGYKYCRPSCPQSCREYPGYEWVPMQDVKVGDRVCFPKVKLPIPTVTKLDLMDIIPNLVCRGDYVNVFCNNTQWESGKVPRYITIDNDLCRLIGYFIGNGWATVHDPEDGYGFGIAFPMHNKVFAQDCERILADKFNAKGFYDINKKKTCIRYSCNRGVITLFFRNLCGAHAINKHVPDFLMVDNPAWIESLMTGLMRTDGSMAGGRISYDSISRDLITQVKTIWAYQGLNSTISTRAVTKKGWHTSYKIRAAKTAYAVHGDMLLTEVKKVEAIDSFQGYVYDFTTDIDHSYIANNSIVHNSVGGSLVGYLMGIHKVDPIQRGTEFFRFCNVERQSPADIDTDVSTLHRGEIINYVKQKYGNIAKVMTIGYTKNPEKDDVGKASIQRAGKALKLEAQALRSLVKRVTGSLKEILECPEFDKATLERLYDVAKHFCYRLDKNSIHASAILVTPDAIENYTPLEGCYSNDTSTGERTYIRAAAYTFHQLEAMGCLKLDILGLSTLDIMGECMRSVGITVDDIPMNDKKTFNTYAQGDLDGVFQMESSGMQRVAKELHVSNFNDVAALVALFRPGPIDSGMLQQYIDAKNGAEVHYPCKAVEELAGNTFGVLVYQEQVMKISMRMAGYSLGQADMLRKVIGRKEITKINQAVKDFVEACVANGYEESVAQFVGEQIRAAGRYLFNLAHSTEYGQLSYKTAYLKTHYPVEYMCAVINSKGKQEDIIKYLPELKRLNIEILEPSYKVGNMEWQVEGRNIRMGLGYIKGVGKNIVLGCKSWKEFVDKNTKTVGMALIKAGAMDSIGKSRAWMIANFEDDSKKLQRVRQCEERIEHYSQLGDTKRVEQWQQKKSEVQLSINAEKEYDEAKGEMEVLGMSFHKLPKILVGIADSVQEFQDKKGNTMARIVFKTDYGEFKGVVFASKWKKKTAWERGRGNVPGITVEQGKKYEFIMDNGVIMDAKCC